MIYFIDKPEKAILAGMYIHWIRIQFRLISKNK